MTGSHPSGTWLREENIATTYEVSRTPAREALRRLEADGLITLHPHRGARVTGFDADPDGVTPVPDARGAPASASGDTSDVRQRLPQQNAVTARHVVRDHG
ncbi:GntR family transcriptional regulator [Streptomyces sp. NPDC127066]|uniref:GntR family transcriptional regulator n=1 Tax=Streptomyces sp. NPDC127066 TaxID=3347125 RepID=UPI0036526763